MGRSKIKDLTRCALAAALMAACAWISLPAAVPFTLQTFGLFLTLELLGGRLGCWAAAAYLGLGLIGVPVFSGFQGGAGVLLGATGGFLTGFLAAALLYRLATHLGAPAPAALVLGLLGCYCFGIGWYMAFFARGTSLAAAVSTCVAPFVVPDMLKLLLAHSLAQRLRRFV